MWEFAKDAPFLFFLCVLVIAWAASRPFYYAFKAYNRTLRSRNILAHGWPQPPMDADGDIVPNSEEVE